MSPILLLAVLLPAAEPSSCASLAACNAQGTTAYKAGRFDDALQAFERQIDYADTAIADIESTGATADAKAKATRESALNNALLALVKGGQCLKARAYLTLTDPQAAATIANRKLYDQHCQTEVTKAAGPVGDYWQYAGHGSWNQATIRTRADGSLELDAFFMRISRGPMDEYGPAAFGSHAGVALDLEGDVAMGDYEGNDGSSCSIELQIADHGFTVQPQQRQDCNTGGSGAYFVGRYEYVSTTPSPPDESVEGQ